MKTGAPSLITKPDLIKQSQYRRFIVTKLSKLAKVNDSFSVYRYDNGWMVEVSGRDKKEDWKTSKVMCNTEDDLIALIKEYNQTDLAE